MNAIRPKWSGNGYTMELVTGVQNAASYAMAGYLVFDDAAETLKKVESGALIRSWSNGKRVAVIRWLAAQSKV